MRRPQPDGSSTWPAAALAACVFNLLLCPFIYIGIGALASIRAEFSWIGVPPLLVSTGYLLVRYLKQPDANALRGSQILAEAMCWLVIASFLTIISGFTLLTTFERIGALCLFFLSATLLSLPLVLLRRTALRERMLQLEPRFAGCVVLVIVLAAGVMATVHLVVPARFI